MGIIQSIEGLGRTKRQEKGEFAFFVCAETSIFSCPQDEVVTVQSAGSGSQSMVKHRVPSRKSCQCLYQENIFKILMAHENQSVLYHNLMVISNKGMKLTVLQRGLLKVVLPGLRERSLPFPVPSQIQELVLTE